MNKWLASLTGVETTRGSSSLHTTCCAACRYLGLKGQPNCVFAPYFPVDEPRKFVDVHRVYEENNVRRILNDLHPYHRAKAVESLVYEAQMRLQYPVHGCVGILCILQKQLLWLRIELSHAYAELSGLTFALAAPIGVRGANSDFETGMEEFYLKDWLKQLQQEEWLMSMMRGEGNYSSIVPNTSVAMGSAGENFAVPYWIEVVRANNASETGKEKLFYVDWLLKDRKERLMMMTEGESYSGIVSKTPAVTGSAGDLTCLNFADDAWTGAGGANNAFDTVMEEVYYPEWLGQQKQEELLIVLTGGESYSSGFPIPSAEMGSASDLTGLNFAEAGSIGVGGANSAFNTGMEGLYYPDWLLQQQKQEELMIMRGGGSYSSGVPITSAAMDSVSDLTGLNFAEAAWIGLGGANNAFDTTTEELYYPDWLLQQNKKKC